jgi:translation initiation factor IF-3
VPVPRRFDRRLPERDQTRINDRIRVPEVRLVGDDGKQIGVVTTAEALAYAQERDLDLVEVAPDARPPVCRVLDYSKYKYEQAQKLKAARKHQQQITIREIKFRPKIAQNDYDTKKGHVARFLNGKDKVKVTIMFRGREVTHPERGTALLERLAGELADIAVVEQTPLQDGRNMTMMLGPSKSILAAGEEHHADAEGKPAKKYEKEVPADFEEAPADLTEGLAELDETPEDAAKAKADAGAEEPAAPSGEASAADTNGKAKSAVTNGKPKPADAASSKEPAEASSLSE